MTLSRGCRIYNLDIRPAKYGICKKHSHPCIWHQSVSDPYFTAPDAVKFYDSDAVSRRELRD